MSIGESKAVDYQLLADTAVLAGEIMLTSGAETYRVEDTIRRILMTSGFERCEVFVVTTGIMITLSDWRVETISLVRRVNDKNTDLGKIYETNNISRRFCDGELTLKETFRYLKKIKNDSAERYSNLLVNSAFIFTAAFFTGILGGKLTECIFAAVNGIFIVAMRLFSKKFPIHPFVMNICVAFLMAVASRIYQVIPSVDISLEPLIAGSIMALLPGVAITNAIRDTLQGDYMSGTARAIEAFVIAATLAVGIGAGLSFIGLFINEPLSGNAGVTVEYSGIVVAAQTLEAFLAVAAMTIILSVPRKYIAYASLTGAAGWLMYLAALILSKETIFSTFVSVIVISLMSQILARTKKAPVTMFLIPGILPLVPGVGMYRIVYYMIDGNSELSSYYFSNTLQIAGMIAIAIFFVDTVFRTAKLRRNKKSS